VDRRGFFKTFFYTPLITPLLFSFKSSNDSSILYLIYDSPQEVFSSILEELQRFGLIQSHHFTLLNTYPEEKEMKRVLSQKGWRLIPFPSASSLNLSFTRLHQNVPPSFALIKDSRVLDIRSRGFYSLWKKMNKEKKSSSWMTVASSKNKHASPSLGSSASIYLDGHQIEKISLKRNMSKSFKTQKGSISITIENGKAWVSNSSCRQKICLFSPPAIYVGDRIICAPNHFFLEINGYSSVDTVIG